MIVNLIPSYVRADYISQLRQKLLDDFVKTFLPKLLDDFEKTFLQRTNSSDPTACLEECRMTCVAALVLKAVPQVSLAPVLSDK